MMPGVCEVCSKEASKYKCPTCNTLSCSLGCTQAHKIYCAPKQCPEPAKSTGLDQQQHSESTQCTAKKDQGNLQLGDVDSTAEIEKLFAEYPGLRAKLREIFKATQEEDWNTITSSEPRHSSHYRGNRHHQNNRGPGPWTAEKGFNRGLGRVRKWRESCEGGQATGSDDEGFMKFIALVAGDRKGSS